MRKLFRDENNISRLSAYTIVISFSIFISCKPKNYIRYYNKVNKIDSIYRFANKPQKAVKKYRRLFRKYSPKNQEGVKEYDTYIQLSDQYYKNFGGEKSLYNLLDLVAPYGNTYKGYFSFFKKYGVDSTAAKQHIADWKKNLNKQLIDSFTIAMVRDQDDRIFDSEKRKRNVKKNAELFIWTFKNFGFPSLQKIGYEGNNNVFIAMPTLITHMNESPEYYPYIKEKIFEYVKSGDCPPNTYKLMVDAQNLMANEETLYTYNPGISKDSAQINRNRKSIGLPSLKHSAKIRKDAKNK